jgi:alkenylglycerophosphocholine hydrolase
MITALAIAAATSAALAIAADRHDRPERRVRAFFVLKPLTTLLIAGLAAAAPESPYRDLILVALALSLAGDTFLMFGSDRAFMLGLVSFLLAHLAFVAAFMQGVHAVTLPFWLAGVVAYAVALLLVVLLPRAGRMKLAVLLYCAVLAAMVFAAAARHQALGTVDSRLALAGALLFMASDSLLGCRRFVGRYRGAQVLILSTYWAAIGLIAWSA